MFFCGSPFRISSLSQQHQLEIAARPRSNETRKKIRKLMSVTRKSKLFENKALSLIKTDVSVSNIDCVPNVTFRNFCRQTSCPWWRKLIKLILINLLTEWGLHPREKNCWPQATALSQRRDLTCEDKRSAKLRTLITGSRRPISKSFLVSLATKHCRQMPYLLKASL